MHLLTRKLYQLLFPYNSSTKLQISIEFAGVIGTKDRLQDNMIYDLKHSTLIKRTCTVVNSLGLVDIKFVKINSNLDPLNLVKTYSACVLPRSREFAVLMLIEITEP